MSNKPKGTVIQIGLHKMAELYHVGFEEKNLFGAFPMPSAAQEILSAEKEWHYYGVDGDPASIAFMMQRYPLTGNHHWLCHYMGKMGQRVRQNSWFPILGEWIPYNAHAISLEALIVTLELWHIDALFMDIERSEYEVLGDYSWKWKPTYCMIEDHAWNFPDMNMKVPFDLGELMQSKGYTEIFNEDEAIRNGYDQIQYHRHFILKE